MKSHDIIVYISIMEVVSQESLTDGTREMISMECFDVLDLERVEIEVV